MREESVARRYAAALFDLAKQRGVIDAVDKDLTAVADAYRNIRSFRTILSDPEIDARAKKGALNGVFKSRVGEPTLSFLNLLVDKRRFDMLLVIQREFDALAMTQQNIARATAVTAVALTAAEQKALIQSLETKTGKHIELTVEVDPDVLGGVLVRIGDTVYDGTVRGGLDRLRTQLMGS